MRALFVCPDMRTGGAERHWATLTPALRERGLDARVLCLADEGGLFADLVETGVPVYCSRMSARRDPRGLRRAFAYAADAAPDVVVTRGVSAQLVGEALARRARAPHVYNEHTPLTPAGELLPMRPHQRALTRLVAPLVSGVIAVTERQVKPLTRLGYRRERIEVVPNGVFAGSVAPSREREAVRAALGLNEGDFMALAVSRLQPEKRVDVFVEAIARLAGERDAPGTEPDEPDAPAAALTRPGDTAAGGPAPRVRAFVAGHGDERARLEPAARRAGVELLGVRRDVPDLMLAADVVCLTSDSEALPISILEAMALGRPVLATDVGGTPEQIEDGVSGLLVPPGDSAAVATALQQLAADPAAARALGERGRERQRQRFDGDAMVDGYLRVLAAAVAA